MWMNTTLLYNNHVYVDEYEITIITKYMWMNTKLLYNNQVYVDEYEITI